MPHEGKGHLEDLDPELPFLESLLSFATVGVDGCCSSSSTFFLISSLFSDGTGLSELVGVWVLDAFLDDFLVSGDCSILCFHSSSRFIDSSLYVGMKQLMLCYVRTGHQCN